MAFLKIPDRIRGLACGFGLTGTGGYGLTGWGYGLSGGCYGLTGGFRFGLVVVCI